MTAAVLLIDLQNGFCAPTGSMSGDEAALVRYAAAVEEAATLSAVARSRHLPLIYTRHCFRPGYPELSSTMRFLPKLRAEGGLQLGTWDADIVAKLTPAESDVVIDKRQFDAFLGTELDALLRASAVESVVVAGVSTNMCVESTVRTAAQLGYEVLVAADATAATSVELHEGALRGMSYGFAAVAPWRSFRPFG